MAIAVVGTETFNSGFGGTATGPTPPVGSVGDHLVAQVETDGATVTTPTGWTLITSNTGGAGLIYAFYREATGTDTLSSTISASVGWGVRMNRYSGVDPDTVLDVAAINNYNPGDGLVSLSGLTTITDGALLIGGAVTNSGSGTWTISGLTEVSERVGGRSEVYGAVSQGTAGNTGAVVFTASNGFAGTAGWLAALRPYVAPPITYLAPDTDVNVGTWLRSDNDGNTSLFEMVDEDAGASNATKDADYIYSELLTTTPALVRFEVQPGTDPGVDTGVQVVVRASKDLTGGDTTHLHLKLYEGATLRATTTDGDAGWPKVLTDTWTDYEWDVPEAEVATITDFTALRPEGHAVKG
jgi:hypothetical protein